MKKYRWSVGILLLCLSGCGNKEPDTLPAMQDQNVIITEAGSVTEKITQKITVDATTTEEPETAEKKTESKTEQPPELNTEQKTEPKTEQKTEQPEKDKNTTEELADFEKEDQERSKILGSIFQAFNHNNVDELMGFMYERSFYVNPEEYDKARTNLITVMQQIHDLGYTFDTNQIFIQSVKDYAVKPNPLTIPLDTTDLVDASIVFQATVEGQQVDAVLDFSAVLYKTDDGYKMITLQFGE